MSGGIEGSRLTASVDRTGLDTGLDIDAGASLKGGDADPQQQGSTPQSALDRLMAGADTLARFRGEVVDMPASPVTQPGDLVRPGDVRADAGAHLATPAMRGPDVTVTATVGPTAAIEARLSFAAGNAGQPPWANATVRVREPGQVEQTSIGMRLLAGGTSQASARGMDAALQNAGYRPAQGPPTTGSLVLRGATLEIIAPGGRTVLLATADGGAVLRTGDAQRAAVFVKGGTPTMTAAQATGETALPLSPQAQLLASIGLGAGSLAALLATLGGGEQPVGLWLARPDGNPAAAGPALDYRNRWSELKDRLAHDPARIARMEAVLYDALAARFAVLGVDLATRSPVLRDVVWALAVEHGPWAARDGSDVVSAMAAGRRLDLMSDADLVRALFDEQLRRDASGRLVHYAELGADDLHAAVADRLAREREIALDRLAAEA